MLLAPSAVEEVVRGTEGLGDEYEVVVERTEDRESITLKVEILPEARARQKEIETRLRDQLRLKTNLGYVLEMHDVNTLPRYEVKAKRFKDRRKEG